MTHPTTILSNVEPDVEHTFADMQVLLDLGPDASFTLKALGVPLAHSVLMPVSWDAGVQPRDASTESYLKVGFDSPARFTLTSRVRAPGGDAAFDARERTVDLLSRAGVTLNPPAPALSPLRVDDPLPVNALKLLIALLAYSNEHIDEADGKDRIELTIDKLLLLTALPLMVEAAKAAVTGKPNGTYKPEELAALDNDILARFRATNPDGMSLLTLARRNYAGTVSFKPDEWIPLVAELGRWQGKPQLLMPLEVLDEALRRALDDAWKAVRNADGWAAWWGLVESRIPQGGQRRGDVGFFYGLVDRLGQEAQLLQAASVNVAKLEFRKTIGPKPFVHLVDLRAPIWQREVSVLAAERALADRRRKLALQRIAGNAPVDPATVELASQEARLATRTLTEVQRQLDALTSEVAEVGFKIADGAPLLPDMPDKSIRREYWVTRIVNETRRGTRTITETYRSSGFFGIGAKTRKRTRTEEYTYTEQVERKVKIEEPLEGGRPLAEYLAKPLTADFFPSGQEEGVKQAYQRVFGKPVEQLQTRDKDVRLFELHSTGYRDQHGNSLERVLLLANDADLRLRLVLLMPVHERRPDGTLELVRYVAIHHPVAPRRTNLQPRVFLVETYRHSLAQAPGHYVGALAHSVCLFPGEVRRLKLLSETRLVTQQRQESRATQRSAVEQRSNVRRQLRNDFSNMKRNAKQSTWNANASGGVNLGFVQFGGGASGGQQWNSASESVAKTLDDRVSESLHAVSGHNEVQLATLSQQDVTQVTSSEQVIELHNVNQGRAVTHKLFQVTQRHTSSVQLDSARVVVEYGEQLVPGFEVFRTEVFGLDQLQRMFPELADEDRARAQAAVRQLIVERLRSSVGKGGTVQDEDGVLRLTSKPLSEQTYHVNSGALFVDSEVAPQAATEPYIERTRDAEVALQKARAERLGAEAKALVAGTLVLPDAAQTLSIGLGQRGAHAATDTNGVDSQPGSS